MSYIINKTDGTQLLTLLDGILDTSTSMFLIGKNYPGYGELQQENFVRLLESGANSVAPARPIKGQLWYDTVTNKLKIYDGTVFKGTGPTTSSTAPTTPVTGDLWWDTVNDQLKTYTSGAWKVIGPTYSKVEGLTGAVVETVYDSVNAAHILGTNWDKGARTAIFSKDSTFTPNVAISGFGVIRPGLNININSSNPFSITPTGSSGVALVNGSTGGNVDIQANVGGTLTSALRINGSTGLVTVFDDPTNNLGIATKQYVDVATSGTDTNLNANVAIINASIAVLTANAAAQANSLTNLNNIKANIASPTFTGTPLSTTPSTDDSSTKIATTAFVKNSIAAATNSLWQGSTKFVSTVEPSSGDGADGDIWFQI
jgi:hypothetical protein